MRPSDGVLELGCSYGAATEILAAAARSVVALDNSPELSFANLKILLIFGGLVLGCIKTKFCKKICV